MLNTLSLGFLRQTTLSARNMRSGFSFLSFSYKLVNGIQMRANTTSHRMKDRLFRFEVLTFEMIHGVCSKSRQARYLLHLFTLLPGFLVHVRAMLSRTVSLFFLLHIAAKALGCNVVVLQLQVDFFFGDPRAQLS